jgi:hypothetical protein
LRSRTIPRRADHVSGYRTTGYVVSAYTRRGEIVSTQYNRPVSSHHRADPAAADESRRHGNADERLFHRDLIRPFDAVPNQVPLDQVVRGKKLSTNNFAKMRFASAELLDEPDRCPEGLLNRILWRAMKGTSVPYPEWAITTGVADDDD